MANSAGVEPDPEKHHQHPDRPPPIHREGSGQNRRHAKRRHHRAGQSRWAVKSKWSLCGVVQHVFQASEFVVCGGGEEKDEGGGMKDEFFGVLRARAYNLNIDIRQDVLGGILQVAYTPSQGLNKCHLQIIAGQY